MECWGDDCASPAPTGDPYSVLPNPDDWPEPPEWMFTAIYVVIAIMALALLVTLVAALVTWRRKSGEVTARQPASWVDLNDLPDTSRGGVRGVRESGPLEVHPPDSGASHTEPDANPGSPEDPPGAR